jgi:2-polyprenyl-6-methoxyphenol hydroxylase-like FAD-dependent oxidoreductase
MAPRKVLIAGASIAGPTLAYWLDRYGMEPTVVERALELRLGGQNVDVRGAGRVVAARTGIEDAVRAAGTGEQGLAFVDATGATQAAFPATTRDGQGDGGDSFTAELEILRGDLAEILYDHTRDRVPYRFGDSIAALDDDGRRVRVGFEHGPEEDFDVVIAADGLRSTTREIAMPEQADIRFLGLCMAYFTIPRDATDTDWWRWYAAGTGAPSPCDRTGTAAPGRCCRCCRGPPRPRG